jgi:hypothetical protein
MSNNETNVKGSFYFETLQHGRQLLIDQIVKDSQLNAEDLDRFEIRFLPSVRGFRINGTELGLLRENGLVNGGIVQIPVLAIVPKNGTVTRESMKNLRIEFSSWRGDMEEVPHFFIGLFHNQTIKELDPRDSFDLFSSYIDNPHHCIGFRWESLHDAHMNGRNPATAFHIMLPSGWEALFDENGMLRDESNLKRIASFMARRVDLDPKHLDREGHEDYSYWCGALSNRKEGQGSLWAIKNSFEISETVPGSYVLDGDIPVELAIQKGKTDTQELIMTIKNIQIYPSDYTGQVRQLAHLVRPKENNPKGDLIITISEKDEWSAYVTRNGDVDPTIEPVGFTNIDTLAILLAKMGTT